MRLSEAENKIKKDLAERTLQPSDALWDNIQQELDQKQSKPKIAYLWWKVGSVAAVLCLALLAYQGFHSTSITMVDVVLDSKPVKIKEGDIKAEDFEIKVVHRPLEVQSLSAQNPTFQEELAIVVKAPVKTPEVESTQEVDEAEMLLAIAQEELKKQKEKKLVAEVNSLLEDAISETEDIQQKNILQNMKAEVLLAQVESEIELEKPPLLKFEIWDAIVSNFNEVKGKFALN